MKFKPKLKRFFNLTAKLLWFKITRRNKRENEISTTEVTNIENPSLQLSDIFECPKKYDFILKILVEQKLIAPRSTFWIDYGKGNKALMIALLKFLQVQGYYNLKTKISSQQIIEIAWNTFGLDISISHTKHVKYDDSILDFIPLSNTVKL